MGEDRLHVVFGTGQVGSALAAHLAGMGIAVRAVSRHRPPALAAGVDWRAADAADPEAAADAAKGASVQFGEPFILDTSKYESTFGAAGTPLPDAIAATLAWYRTRPDTP
jgi:hypothetical protein